MITSSTEKLASYPVKTTAAQNEHSGDLEISSSGATPGPSDARPKYRDAEETKNA